MGRGDLGVGTLSSQRCRLLPNYLDNHGIIYSNVSAMIVGSQGCAGTVWYGVPALILEALRCIGGSCCYNGGIRWAAYAVDFTKMSKIPNCYSSDAFIKLKMHQNSFSAGAPPRTSPEELTTLPQTP